ncbi:MAG: hypothetical protein ACM30D_04330 [Hyphomicrobiales bacterium]
MLDAPARDLLVRAGVLRRPGDRALLMALAGDEGKPAIDRLRTTALLTEIREPKTGGGWTSSYEVHPIVRELAERRSDRTEALRREGHRRTGDHLELEARTSPSWQNILDGAYHLRQVGEADRAYDLLEPLAKELLERGRVLDARAVLAEIGDPASLHPSRAAWFSTFHGDAAVAYGDLAQALTAHTASLAIAERLAAADPSNLSWQLFLSARHFNVGDVLALQGQLDAALDAYTESLAIAERLAKADPGNASCQRDLFVSYSKLGLIEEQKGSPASYYSNAEKIIRELARLDPTNAQWQQDLAWIEVRLAAASASEASS